MEIPRNRSEYLPNFPFKLMGAGLVIIGLCLFIYSAPVLTSDFDQVDPVTRTTTVPTEYTTTNGETEYGAFNIKTTTPTTGEVANGSVRIRMQAGWGNPYDSYNIEDRPKAPLGVAIIAAPASWRPDRAGRDGKVLFKNMSVYNQGEYVTFERVLDVPASIEPEGIGPTEATLYYYAESNSGTTRFEPLRTYTIYRPFGQRPRAKGLLAAVVLLVLVIPAYHPSVQTRLGEPLKRYADWQWKQDLNSKAQTLDEKFDTDSSTRKKSTIVESVEEATRQDLEKRSQQLHQFAILNETIENISLEKIPFSKTNIQSLATQAWEDNDTKTANDLVDVLTVSESGFEVRVRGQNYDATNLFDRNPTDSINIDQLSQTASEINRFQTARRTVEKWGKMDSDQSKLAVSINDQVVEPTTIWEKIDTILSEGDLDQFCQQAEIIEDFATQTEPLRNNQSPHPLHMDQIKTSIIDNARQAIHSGDIETIETAMMKAEAWAAEQELLNLFQTTNLTHSSIDPDDVQNRINEARSIEDYKLIKSIRDEVIAQLDSTWRPTDLLSLTPTEFEEILGQMYQQKGYNVQVTQQSADRGIDAIARNNRQTIAIQAKRYDPNGAGNVSGPEVRNAIGATVQEGADMCVVATSSGFTSDAKRAAKETKNIEVRLLPAEDVALNLSEEQIPNPT